ncbi:alpha/beta hydrolase [Streptomyces sp. NPDC049744]|uniref:alpha/beta hydrolase n=1 Tax=Streptomyces sp. NPDC049744 TaxID=3154359 RepID=UPI00341930AF
MRSVSRTEADRHPPRGIERLDLLRPRTSWPDAPHGPIATWSADGPREEQVVVPAGRTHLTAGLSLPATTRVVLSIAHSAGGGRPGSWYAYTAPRLHRAGIGTLLLGLLTEEERSDRHKLFDVVLLARRLETATQWLRRETGLPVGYVGSEGGAPAALRAAAADDEIRAVVSLGGRPELAGPAALARVRAPTLFVVGGLDPQGAGLSRLAADWMHCRHHVTVVPGATGVLAGPGAAETLTDLIRDWFTTGRE